MWIEILSDFYHKFQSIHHRFYPVCFDTAFLYLKIMYQYLLDYVFL